MPYRTPARWLAPLALVGAIIAILVVVNSDSGKSSKSGGATVTSSSTASKRTQTTATPRNHHKYYVVKPGDVLSGIAAKSGVPLAQIMRLNPHVDAQTLTVGTKLKLAP
jgi:LysM repeat protein